MQFNPYGGTAAQIAADLVNARPTATAEAIDDIIETRDYRPARKTSPGEAAQLATWAERLREVFAERDLDTRVRLVNAMIASTATKPYLSQHEGRAPHFHYATTDASLVERLIAYTTAGLAHAICEDPGRLGRCGRPGCGVVYVDTSRNGRRRFCSVPCANRIYVAAHRGRRRSASGR